MWFDHRVTLLQCLSPLTQACAVSERFAKY